MGAMKDILAIAQEAQQREEQKDMAAKAFHVSRERWDHIEDQLKEMLYPDFYG